MLRHTRSEGFVWLSDLLCNLVVQNEQDRKLFDRTPVDKEDRREAELFSLLVEHFVELTSSITLTSSLFDPWPVTSHRICWLRLWESGVLLEVEDFGFGLLDVVRYGKQGRRKD